MAMILSSLQHSGLESDHPRWRKAILTLHVAAAVGWLGVDLVLPPQTGRPPPRSAQ
jgi:hypothetical protein